MPTNSNSLPVVAGVEITTDAEGRFNLNALHKASGESDHKKPLMASHETSTRINRRAKHSIGAKWKFPLRSKISKFC